MSPRENDHSPVPDRGHRPHSQRAAVPIAPVSAVVYAWMLATVAAVVFLAGGPMEGSLGVFLLCAGLALVIFPARVRVEWPIWLAAGGLVACGATAFLPARWFPAPSWRVALSAASGIHLPATVTPLPWETGFWLAILAISCLLGLFLLSHPVRSKTVFGIAVAAVLVCGVYAAMSIYARQTGWHYPFAGGATFGFFPNRNHTATFLVTGSILSLGVLTITLRESRWTWSLLVGAALTLCVVGLFFYSGSRGGVIFLMLGILIWVAGLGRTHRSIPLTVSLAVLAVAAGLLFLRSGGEARARLLSRGESVSTGTNPVDPTVTGQQSSANPLPSNDHDTPFDFRALIYRDAVDLIKEVPITGTGLGTFASIFVEYRHASISSYLALHPESDWLMLAAEAGLPALVFFLVLVGLLSRRLRGASVHPYWPLRWACLAAATAALLHGIVDVPTHRLALGWWILLLAGLGLQAGRGRNEKSGVTQRLFFVLGGLGALALGVQLIRAEWYGGPALPPFAAAEAERTIQATFERGDAWAAMQQAQAAVEVSPLAAPLYFQLGFMLLHFQDSDDEVDEAFKAQRLLRPAWPDEPLRQGDVLTNVDAKKTATLWLDALDRKTVLEHAAGRADHAVVFYHGLLERGRQWPDVQRELLSGIQRGPDYLLAWLDGAEAPLVCAQLPQLAAQPDRLGTLNTAQRERFLLFWYAKGDRADLTRFLGEHADWQASASLVELHELVGAGKFEEAVRVAAEHYAVSLAMSADADVSGGDSALAGRLAKYNLDWQAGNFVPARHILGEPLEESDRSPAAVECWRLRAALSAHDQNWQDAWEALRRYLQLAHPEDNLP